MLMFGEITRVSHQPNLLMIVDRPWRTYHKLPILLLAPAACTMLYLIYEWETNTTYRIGATLFSLWLLAGGVLLLSDNFFNTTWKLDKESRCAILTFERPFPFSLLPHADCVITVPVIFPKTKPGSIVPFEDVKDVVVAEKGMADMVVGYTVEFILKNGTKVKVIPVYRWGAQHPQLEEKIVDKIKAFLV